MIKLIFTMKRKSGMSRVAFIDHYENSHVPLALGFMPPFGPTLIAIGREQKLPRPLG